MSFDKLISSISAIINWSEDEQQEFLLQCRVVNYSKDQIILKSAQVSKNIYFVNSGILTTSILYKDTDVQKLFYISFPESYITSWTSFLTDLSSPIEITALEDSECIVIPEQALNWLFENVREGETFGKKLYENEFLNYYKRISLIYEKALDIRYALMLELYPQIEMLVSKTVISNFLDVSLEHLSREL